MIGRKEIEKQHNYPFTTVLRDAELNIKSFTSKWLDDNNNKIVSIDIKWESSGHRTPDGKPIPSIRYALLNFIAIQIFEKDGAAILKIVLAHNNDYTSTYTQEDRKKVVNKNNNAHYNNQGIFSSY
jgi:hypothetical protein